MSVSARLSNSATGSTHNEAQLQKIRFVNVLYCVCVLSYYGRQCVDTGRSAVELVNQSRQIRFVNSVAAQLVYSHCVQSVFRHFDADYSVASHLSEISYSFEKSIGNTRRATASPCNFHSA